MKTLVIGSKGRQGRRYMAALRYLKEDVIGVDYGDSVPTLESFTHAIIATPTSDHFFFAQTLMYEGKSVLCEKPVSKDITEIHHLLGIKNDPKGYGDFRMVCNWLYAITRALQRGHGPKGKPGAIAVMQEMVIEYDYFLSGEDGFFWDCIQLLYMAGRFKFKRESPVFSVAVDGNPVTLEDIEASYLMMVSEWLHGDRRKLWSLEDALHATERVEWAMKNHDEKAGDIDFMEAFSPFYGKHYIGEH